jgi:hypothetical protein
MQERVPTPMQRRNGPALFGAVPPLLGCVGALLLGACGGDAHELGFTLEAPPTPFFTEGEGFVGSWIGEASEPLAYGATRTAPAYQFPSGSSQFRLQIKSLPGSTDPAALGGSLSFGKGPPPPPPTDGSRGYPLGFNYQEYLSYPDPAGGIENYADGLPPFEGFAYAVESRSIGSGVPDGVLRLVYDPRSYLDAWCGLQVSHEQPDGTFGALPFAAGGTELMADGKDRQCAAYDADDLSACPADMATLPLDQYVQTYRACHQLGPVVFKMSCDRIFLTRFCSCTELACGAGSRTNQSELLLRSAGNSLVGVFDGATFLNARGLTTPLGEVRFRRLDD